MLFGIDNGGEHHIRIVSHERGQQLASSLGMTFIEFNPKTDDIAIVNEV